MDTRESYPSAVDEIREIKELEIAIEREQECYEKLNNSITYLQDKVLKIRKNIEDKRFASEATLVTLNNLKINVNNIEKNIEVVEELKFNVEKQRQFADFTLLEEGKNYNSVILKYESMYKQCVEIALMSFTYQQLEKLKIKIRQMAIQFFQYQTQIKSLNKMIQAFLAIKSEQINSEILKFVILFKCLWSLKCASKEETNSGDLQAKISHLDPLAEMKQASIDEKILIKNLSIVKDNKVMASQIKVEKEEKPHTPGIMCETIKYILSGVHESLKNDNILAEDISETENGCAYDVLIGETTEEKQTNKGTDTDLLSYNDSYMENLAKSNDEKINDMENVSVEGVIEHCKEDLLTDKIVIDNEGIYKDEENCDDLVKLICLSEEGEIESICLETSLVGDTPDNMYCEQFSQLDTASGEMNSLLIKEVKDSRIIDHTFISNDDAVMPDIPLLAQSENISNFTESAKIKLEEENVCNSVNVEVGLGDSVGIMFTAEEVMDTINNFTVVKNDTWDNTDFITQLEEISSKGNGDAKETHLEMDSVDCTLASNGEIFQSVIPKEVTMIIEEQPNSKSSYENPGDMELPENEITVIEGENELCNETNFELVSSDVPDDISLPIGSTFVKQENVIKSQISSVDSNILKENYSCTEDFDELQRTSECRNKEEQSVNGNLSYLNSHLERSFTQKKNECKEKDFIDEKQSYQKLETEDSLGLHCDMRLFSQYVNNGACDSGKDSLSIEFENSYCGQPCTDVKDITAEINLVSRAGIKKNFKSEPVVTEACKSEDKSKSSETFKVCFTKKSQNPTMFKLK